MSQTWPTPEAPANPKELDVLVISDQHLGVPNILSAWQRHFFDTVTARTIITAGDTRDPERERLHRRGTFKKLLAAPRRLRGFFKGAPPAPARPDRLSENDLSWYDSRNAAAARGAALVEPRGNHDDPLRAVDGQTRHGVRYAEQEEFTAGDGKKFLVIHGDQFDPALRHLTGFARGMLKPLAALMDDMNTVLLAAGGLVARATQAIFGKSFNPYGAATTAAEVLFGRRASFDRKAARFALDHGKDVLVHGHLHDPHITVFKKGDLVESFQAAARENRAPRRATHDVTVIDIGDGVESSTALFVDRKGEFRLLTAADDIRERGAAPREVREENKRLYRAARSEPQVEDLNRIFAGNAAVVPFPLREVAAPESHASGIISVHRQGPPDIGTLRAG